MHASDVWMIFITLGAGDVRGARRLRPRDRPSSTLLERDDRRPGGDGTRWFARGLGTANESWIVPPRRRGLRAGCHSRTASPPRPVLPPRSILMLFALNLGGGISIEVPGAVPHLAARGGGPPLGSVPFWRRSARGRPLVASWPG